MKELYIERLSEKLCHPINILGYGTKKPINQYSNNFVNCENMFMMYWFIKKVNFNNCCEEEVYPPMEFRSCLLGKHVLFNLENLRYEFIIDLNSKALIELVNSYSTTDFSKNAIESVLDYSISEYKKNYAKGLLDTDFIKSPPNICNSDIFFNLT